MSTSIPIEKLYQPPSEASPLVSIITVTKNSENYLEQSIKSVIEQTYDNIEHIIIDGKSNDSTLDIIKKHETSLAYWASEIDNSMYEAINKGIRACSGEIIAVLNSDDRYANKSVIESIVQFFKKTAADGIYGDLIIDYGKKFSYKNVFQVSYYDYLISGKGTFVPHPTLFITRNCLQNVGYYDTHYKYAADYDYILRCLYQCRIKYHSIPITIFRRHSASITATGKIKPEKIDIIKNISGPPLPTLKTFLIRLRLWLKYYGLNATFGVLKKWKLKYAHFRIN